MNFQQLWANRQNYLWTVNDDQTVTIGGYTYSDAREYGSVRLKLDSEYSYVYVTLSDGVSNCSPLAERPYSNKTQQYLDIKAIFDEIGDYLEDSATKQHQEVNREILVQNVQNLLPQYYE